ncbi:hypothetical protein FRB94_012992 [Tulasnella sp. JGI-2019a]|nr:hypothetical protein FRB93_001719 [Tulasnella sp. JGI-2019a]KAG9008768.1 hypothetical protein FRB94_012992 [Tulasnella sp. JGI-2019a]
MCTFQLISNIATSTALLSNYSSLPLQATPIVMLALRTVAISFATLVAYVFAAPAPQASGTPSSVSIPTFSVPPFSAPSGTPSFSAPSGTPSSFSIPTFSAPSISLPSISIPSVTFSLPTFTGTPPSATVTSTA